MKYLPVYSLFSLFFINFAQEEKNIMKIPFNIKYKPKIQYGEVQLETEYGNPVRIICWDKIGGFPIVGLFNYIEDGKEYEDVECWEKDGTALSEIEGMDLYVIIPDNEK